MEKYATGRVDSRHLSIAYRLTAAATRMVVEQSKAVMSGFAHFLGVLFYFSTVDRWAGVGTICKEKKNELNGKRKPITKKARCKVLAETKLTTY